MITGGYNVYPREVEDVLLADPAVGEAAVVGVAGPRVGRARRRLRRRRARRRRIDTDALDRRCLEAIARHKRPKEYRVVEELPRNTAGKVLKNELRSSRRERSRMAHVDLLDSTLRDGQQSLWGMRMQAGMALPVADVLDRTGFRVIDGAGSSFMEVLVKYCREDPWEGLDLLRGRDPPHAHARRACAATRACPSASRPTP